VVLLLGVSEFMRRCGHAEGRFYEWGPYSFAILFALIDEHHRWWDAFNPRCLILGGGLLGFRRDLLLLTEKAYYRAFFQDSAGCESGEWSAKTYKGETRFPFGSTKTLFFHRLFSVFSRILFLVFLWNGTFSRRSNFRWEIRNGSGHRSVCWSILF